MDDGENIRILGYVVTENKNIEVTLLEELEARKSRSLSNLRAEENELRTAIASQAPSMLQRQAGSPEPEVSVLHGLGRKRNLKSASSPDIAPVSVSY